MIVLVVVLAALIYFIVRDDGGDSTITDVNSDQPEEQSDAVSDPTPIPTPVLMNQYEVGDILWVKERGYLACPTAERETYYPCTHLSFGDLVEVTGPASLKEGGVVGTTDYWRWPMKVVQGGIYLEGEDVLIPDSVQLVKHFLQPRPIPDFGIGDRVKVNYNFILRDSPAGDPVSYDQFGNGLLIYGGQSVVITDGPVLGPDDRYWCEIASDFDQSGWVSCEFRWIPRLSME